MASRIDVMSLGVLQQIDTPQNLYDHPQNKFVAGFIGSPAMNFFDAILVKDNGKLYVDGGSFNVEIPDANAKKYVSHAGKNIVFGIRPEDIHNPEFAPPGISPAKLEASVEVTELMGNEIFAYLANGEHSFVARVDPRSKYSLNDKVQIAFNMGNFHIFDKETDQAL